MPKASEKQMEYATQISKLLNIDMPNTDDKIIVGAFIAHNKDAAKIKQEEVNHFIYDRIRTEVKITDIAREMGFTLEKKGNYFSTKEHDSIRIQPDMNRFIRYSTDEKGTVIDFIKIFSNQSEREIVNNLAKRIGIIDGYSVVFTADRSQMAKPVAETKEKKFELPPQGQNMRNVFAYLTQARYIQPEVIQDLVDKKQIYQDARRNCVFVSYKNEQPVFASYKGTNTFVPFEGDVYGSDYKHGWFVDNQASKLHVTEAPIDAMSRMSILQSAGKDYHEYDYLSFSGQGKYHAVVAHLQEKPYSEVLIGTDNDKAGNIFLENIMDEIQEQFPDVKITVDQPILTKDWNDELKYLFAKGYRYENYINPSEETMRMMEEQMKALAEADSKKYYETRDMLDKQGIPREIKDYMYHYLENHFDDAMQELGTGKKETIRKVISNYNKNISLAPKAPQLTAQKGLEI